MRIFLTGGTGFIGGVVARRLRERGDDVVALVRTPAKAATLREIGCTLVPGDLADEASLAHGMEGADAVIHSAAMYEIGVPASRRAVMWDANVGGTERVLRTALKSGVEKVVYVSTVAVFGNTAGQLVDETFEHQGRYTSIYEETKHHAHLAAKRLIEQEGVPCTIVMPGGVYGPDDPSQLGQTMNRFLDGKLPALPFQDGGFTFVHVDDVADGVIAALDRGVVGESYVLGGERATIGEVARVLAKLSGRKPPRNLPTPIVRLSAPFGRLIGPLLGFPPNMRELIDAASGVSYWASHDKAMTELGYSPRGLEQGLRDLFAASGRPIVG